MFGYLQMVNELLSPSKKEEGADNQVENEEKEVDKINTVEAEILSSSLDEMEIEIDGSSKSMSVLVGEKIEENVDVEPSGVETPTKEKAPVPIANISHAPITNSITNPNLQPAMQSLYLSSQAKHNVQSVSREYRKQIKDPGLTTKGIRQVEHLAQIFEHMDKVTYIICSPMRRTIHTAYLGFYPLIMDKNIPIIAYPGVREWGKVPTSIGVKMSELLDKFKELRCKVETRLVPDGWETSIGDVYPEYRDEKAAEVREDLYKLGQLVLDGKDGLWNGIEVKGVEKGRDVHIVVVSHGGFLATLEGSSHQRLWNAEYRTYEFAPKEMVTAGAGKFDLVETPESKERKHVIIE
ncbi:hypothetical protein VTL71DRAFT_12107 [Oculimacula yallundae]|uniref:Phosphoglycerate mutase-like protein n=1 Tax=Oculimacula yallundae TaxID=86028 RepID=A0ABR4CSB4_9HELO